MIRKAIDRLIKRAVFCCSSIAVTLVISGCSNLPAPTDVNSSLIILSIEAERALGTNRPDLVSILKKEDNSEISYTSKSGKYYYFANLPAGTYQIHLAAIQTQLANSTSTSNNVTVSTKATNINNFPFDQEIIDASTVNLEAKKVIFMGSVTAEGTSKYFPPGAIEISDVKITRSDNETQAAYEAFKKENKDSGWIDRF
jgi:hypothetical protein